MNLPGSLRPRDPWGRLADLLRASLGWWPGPWKTYAIGVLLVSVGQGVFAAATAWLVRAVVATSGDLALRAAVLGLAAATGKALASQLLARQEVTLSRLLGDELRDRTLRAILVGQRGQGVFAALGAIREVERAAISGGLGAIRALGAMVPLVAVGATLVTGTSLLQGAVVASLGLLLGRTRRRLATLETSALASSARLDAELEAVVRHADLWRVAGSGPVVRGWLRQLGHQAREALGRAQARRAALSGLNEVLAALLLVALLAASQAGLWRPGASLLPLVALITLSYRPLRDWGEARAARRGGEAALVVLRPWLEVSDRASEVAPSFPSKGGAGGGSSAWFPDVLEAEEFGAERHPGRWSFRLPPGSLALLDGPNASGKTTLLRAMLGLEPSTGRLTHGATALHERGTGPAERPFGWSPQDTPVLSMPLAGNVELGGAGSLVVARRWLGDDWGRAFGDQPLGEHGRSLSGGERAWLSVARACATGAPVLLLDEPTASLDADAEGRLVELVAHLRKLHTVLVVTHRPSLWPADAVRLRADGPTGRPVFPDADPGPPPPAPQGEGQEEG